MRHQFDSCSYEELTSCVHARVSWIREYRRFRKDDYSTQYGHIRAGLIHQIVICNSEIKRLLKMRRILKKSSLKNWDTERLGAI